MGEPLFGSPQPYKLLSVLQPIYVIARKVENPSSAPSPRMMTPFYQLSNLL